MKNICFLLLAGLLLHSGKASAQATPNFRLYPDYGTPGQVLDVVVTGNRHLFDQGSTTLLVGFQQVSSTIHVLNDSVFLASFEIASWVAPGDYDVSVVTHYQTTRISSGFHIVDVLPALPPGTISGTVFYDLNESCSLDPGDPGIARRIVQATPGPYYAVTDASGGYNLRLPYGIYTVNRLGENFYDPVCQLDGAIGTISAAHPAQGGVNFADKAYGCQLELRLLGTNLPPSTCRRDAQAQVEITGRPSATMKLNQWVRNAYPTGPDSVWYEVQIWQNGNSDPRTAHAPIDTAFLDLWKGKYRLEAFAEGGCSAAIEFAISAVLSPACRVDILASDTARYRIMVGCHYPMDIWATSHLANECESAIVYMYEVDSNGHIVYTPDSLTRSVHVWNNIPASFHGEWGGTGATSALVAVAQSGCRDTAFVKTFIQPYHPFLHDSVYLDTNQLGVIKGRTDGFDCERPQIQVKRLADDRIVYHESYDSDLQFSVPNLRNGAYEIMAYLPGFYYTDTDTVVIAGARDSTLTNSQPFANLSQALQAYPMPAGRELRVHGADNRTMPLVYDSKGCVRKVGYGMDGEVGVLDVSALKPGLYVLRMGGKSTRFLKE